MAEHISREAAIELLSEPITMSMCLSVDECHHKIAQQRIDRYLIENLPAADVRPVVRATWYWDKDGMDWGIGAWRCSSCKAMSPMWWNADRGSPWHKSGHRFCPNCGADMRPEPPEEE